MKKPMFISRLAGALCIAAVAASGFIGCEKAELFNVNAPEDILDQIDSIQAEKDRMAALDSVTNLTIATSIVGPEDCSAGWWAYFSDYFTVPAGKRLHLKFINHSSGANNWNNWNLAVANAERDTEGYAEYFVLRSDAYGWGGAMADKGYPYVASNISIDYPDLDGDGDIWNDFRSIMQGATVSIEVDHYASGYVYVGATATGTDGTVIHEYYNQGCSRTESLVAWLVADGSSFEMKEAWLGESAVTEFEDQDAVSITASGMPTSLEIGNPNIWGDAVATVTFQDGRTAQLDSADLVFTVPDLTTTGTKTIVYAYDKTLGGEKGPVVANYYTVEVTNPIVAIEVTALPANGTYYIFGDGNDPAEFTFCPGGIEVTATYADGTSGPVPFEKLSFGTVPAAEGQQAATVTYHGTSKDFTAECPVTVAKGTVLKADAENVGAEDFSNGWWSTFSKQYAVAPGVKLEFNLTLYSDNLGNWHSPCTILRREDLSEYCVLRQDNYGWGTSWDAGIAATSNWNWDTFASNLNGSKIVISVYNYGNDSACVHYDVTDGAGESHFQDYAGIAVESANLHTALVTEESYLVIE